MDSFLVSLFLSMGYGLILIRSRQSFNFLLLNPSHNSKFCKGRKTSYVISSSITLRSQKKSCIYLRKEFHFCGTIKLNNHLSPPNYSHKKKLYLTTSPSSIGMVLVQEDDKNHEHVICYLSKGLVGVKIRYSHVEKLTLATFFYVNCFRHYILLRKTTSIALENPMQHILSH